jgi:uncharacterized protein YidB (DUF937 family)
MSLLKSLTDAVLQSAGQKAGLAEIALQNPALMQGVMGLLSKDSAVGGLPGLLAGFQNAGLGDAVESWLGQGPNKPVAAPQVEQALGSNILAQLAAQANLAPSEASDLLSRALPAMVDQLTPKGDAQALDLSSVQSLLGGFLKGRV